jgi:type II restriction/modification system DNA methylase subunit YeeA
LSHDAIKGKKDLKKRFKSYEPFADLYCYFIEAGINLQNQDGVLCFITSNSYLKAEYGRPLRKFVSNKNQIRQIINIEDYQIFESAVSNFAQIM